MYLAKRNIKHVCLPEPQVLFDNLTISIYNKWEQIFSTWSIPLSECKMKETVWDK